METIVLKNRFYDYKLAVTDEGKLFHVSFLPAGYGLEVEPEACARRFWPFPFEAMVNVDFEPLRTPHGNKFFFTGCAQRSVYRGHTVLPLPGGEEHVLHLEDEETGIRTHLHYEVYEESPAIRRYTEVENAGDREVVLDHISSFVLSNFPYFHGDDHSLFLHSFRSSWCYEGLHRADSLAELNVFSRACRGGFTVDSTSTWVCQEYIPYFVLEQREDGIFTAVQIEYSSSWRFELGIGEASHPNWFYMQGGMGNDRHAQWHKRLQPGERFESPRASIAVALEDIENVLNRMHEHQEAVLIRRSLGDRAFPVIFNDWMYLMGGADEEKILAQLDVLRDSGVELYVTDDGWYAPPAEQAEGISFWDRMGEWEVNEARYPHGIRRVTEEIHRRGMKAGIWCEIECVGRLAPHYNDREMLLMRDDAFVTDNGHRFLNFTSEKTQRYADALFDRFVEWGFDYVKIDYNSDSAPGATNCGADSPGQGIHAHRMAYYAWLDALRRRHPGLIIENCSSGGMRLEYGMLSRSDLSSITDQNDFRIVGAINYNVTKVIHPSQCGVWSFICDDFSDEDFLFALTNSMLGRIHLSGDFKNLSESKKAILQEGVDFYKRYRHLLAGAKTYHHTGSPAYADEVQPLRAFELRGRNDEETVLCVQRPNCPEESLTVRIKGLRKGRYRIEAFPAAVMADRSAEELEEGLRVELPRPYSAKVFYLRRL